LQLVPVAVEVVAIRGDFTAPVTAEIEKVARLVLLVFAIEYVALSGGVLPIRIDRKVCIRQAEIGLIRGLVSVTELS
jgi:hypothetical protein